jgi:hypothetical protein
VAGQDVWKSVQVFVASNHNASETLRSIQAQIAVFAHEAGEFVREVRIGEGIERGNGWHKWSAQYLPGPPWDSEDP